MRQRNSAGLPRLLATADLAEGVQTLDLTRAFSRWTPGRAEVLASGDGRLNRDDLWGAETMGGHEVAPEADRIRGSRDGSLAARVNAYLDMVGNPETVACHLSEIDARVMDMERKRRMRDALDSPCVTEMDRPTWLLHHEPSGKVVASDNLDEFVKEIARRHPRMNSPHPGPFAFWACATAPWPGVKPKRDGDLAKPPREIIAEALDHVGGSPEDVVDLEGFERFMDEWRRQAGVRDRKPESVPENASRDGEVAEFLKGWNAKQTLYAWRPDRTRAYVVCGDLREARFEWRREVARQAGSVHRAKASFAPGRRLRA